MKGIAEVRADSNCKQRISVHRYQERHGSLFWAWEADSAKEVQEFSAAVWLSQGQHLVVFPSINDMFQLHDIFSWVLGWSPGSLDDHELTFCAHWQPLKGLFAIVWDVDLPLLGTKREVEHCELLQDRITARRAILYPSTYVYQYQYQYHF